MGPNGRFVIAWGDERYGYYGLASVHLGGFGVGLPSLSVS